MVNPCGDERRNNSVDEAMVTIEKTYDIVRAEYMPDEVPPEEEEREFPWVWIAGGVGVGFLALLLLLARR